MVMRLQHCPIMQGMPADCRASWFMQQHYSPEELEQLYRWELAGGKVAYIFLEVVNNEEKWCAYHVLDKQRLIDLACQPTKEMAARWILRRQYKHEYWTGED